MASTIEKKLESAATPEEQVVVLALAGWSTRSISQALEVGRNKVGKLIREKYREKAA